MEWVNKGIKLLHIVRRETFFTIDKISEILKYWFYYIESYHLGKLISFPI